MSTVRLAAALAAAALLASACAGPSTKYHTSGDAEQAEEARKQREFVAQEWAKSVARVHRVGFPLLVAAAEICTDDRRRAAGHYAVYDDALDHYGGEFRPAARSALGLSERATVLAVAPGSPAEAAGIQPGDVLVSIDGIAVPRRGGDIRTAWHDIGQRLQDGEPAVYVVERDGAAMELEVQPVEACDYPIGVIKDSELNALADGEAVILTEGIVRFVENDEELALVIGHEIAHNAMGHMDKRRTNQAAGAVAGGVLDVLVALAGVNTGGAFAKSGMRMGGGAFSQDFEAEADYVGLYLLARAGYRYESTPVLWRRMAAAGPQSISYGTTHPTTPERFLALEKAVAEIDGKVAEGRALIPEIAAPAAPPVRDAGGIGSM